MHRTRRQLDARRASQVDSAVGMVALGLAVGSATPASAGRAAVFLALLGAVHAIRRFGLRRVLRLRESGSVGLAAVRLRAGYRL
jgi:hypothetical protein